MKNQITKTITFALISILLINCVSASAFATIGMKGLSMADPELAELVNTIICVASPLACLEGKVVGEVLGSAYEELAKQSPETAQAIAKYQEVKEYIDLGAEITEDLELNEEGKITKGSIQFEEKSASFGNLISDKLEKGDISGKGLSLDLATETKFGKEVKTSTLTFTGEESHAKIKGNIFMSVKKADEDTNAFIKFDEQGNVAEADLTASQDTSFTFKSFSKDQTIKVPEGARVVFKNGEIQLIGDKDTEFNFNQKTEKGESEFSSNIKVSENGNAKIFGSEIKGENFEVDGIKIEKGGLIPYSDGHTLTPGTIAEWTDKGLTLSAQNELFLTTDAKAIANKRNWILAEELKLSAKGEGFNIKFNKDNPYATIDPRDNFEIKATQNFEFEIVNRNPNLDPTGKIPKMDIKGDFVINENYKSFYTEEGKIKIKRDGVLFGEGNKYSSTSPIELFVEGHNEKYIVSNFNGIATIDDLTAIEGEAYERYANSIYHKRASVEHRYNYPTIKDFEEMTGKTLSIQTIEGVTSEMVGNPENIRQLIDIYESLPKDVNKASTKINLIDNEKFASIWQDKTKNSIIFRPSSSVSAFYDPTNDEIFIPTNEDFLMGDNEFTMIRHELSHDLHKSFFPKDSKIKDIDNRIYYLKDRINYEIKKGVESNENKIETFKKELFIEEEKRKKVIPEGFLDNWYQTSDYAYVTEDLIDFHTIPITSLGWKGYNYIETEGRIIELDGEVSWRNREIENRMKKVDKMVSDERKAYYQNKYGQNYLKIIEFEKEQIEKFQQEVAPFEKELIALRSLRDKSPNHGFVRAYGALNMDEDIATYCEVIVSNPVFFKKNNLIGEGADLRYKQKIDLLLKNGFITEKEYDAVFNPEKYGFKIE